MTVVGELGDFADPSIGTSTDASDLLDHDEHGPDLARYRNAVGQLYDALVADAELLTSPDRLQAVLDPWLGSPDVHAIVAAGPGGTDRVRVDLHDEIDRHHPDSPSSAKDAAALVRIFLLSQVDASWWGTHRAFDDEAEVRAAPDVVDLEVLARQGHLRFAFRTQPRGLPGRVRNYGRRRFLPAHAPHTSGLGLTLARRDMVALLNGLADEFAAAAPSGTPALWVTSLTRTLEQQHRLRELGYAALLPSPHCVGYAADVEMRWYRRFDADQVLAGLLLDHQDDGLLNVIDEGQAWHICLNPSRIDDLRAGTAVTLDGH